MKLKRAVIFAAIGAVIALAVAVPLGSATAQSGGWANPVQISGTTDSSWFPDIALGPDETVHVVWASGIAHGEEAQNQIDLLLYNVLKDGRWSKPNDIVNPGTGGFASRNSIVMGRDGLLHMLVRSQLRIDYLHAPWDQADSAQAWGAPRKINNQSTPYYDALAMDSAGGLHSFWNESVPDDPKKPRKECPDCSDLFYRRSSDAGKTWSSPINLSNTPEGSAKPQAKIDKDNQVHVVWDEGKDTIVGKGDPVAAMYRRSRDGGTKWDPPVRFTLPDVPGKEPGDSPLPDAPQQIALGLFQNRLPVVVYRSTETDIVYYQFSEDGGATWHKAAALPGVRARDLNDTPWDSYTMATDGAGNVHLILSGFMIEDTDPSLDLRKTDPRNRPRLLHLIWDGRSWSAPEVIVAEDRYSGWSAAAVAACDQIDPDSAQARTDKAKAALMKCKAIELYPEWPRAVIGGNKLHLTWFTRNGGDLFDSDHSHYQVWYSVKQLDAPAVAPLPLFTPLPSVAPGVVTATATPAPTPTLAAGIIDAPPIDRSLAWESPGVLTLGIAALPVIGLLSLVVGARAIVVRHRRRK